jgi:hypothetical protein
MPLISIAGTFKRCHGIFLLVLSENAIESFCRHFSKNVTKSSYWHFSRVPSELFASTFKGCLQLLFQAFNSGAADYFLRHF